MSVALDANSVGNSSSTNNHIWSGTIGTSATTTCTITVGATATILVVGILYESASSKTFTISGFTQVTGTAAINTSGNDGVVYFAQVSPASGSTTISISTTASTAAYVYAQSWTGSVTSSVSAATEGATSSATNAVSSLTETTTSSIPTTDQVMALFGTSSSGSFAGTSADFPNGTWLDSDTAATNNCTCGYEAGTGAAVALKGVSGSSTDMVGAIVGIVAAASATTSVGLIPSKLLLPPMSRMVGWRGLQGLKAYSAGASTSLTALSVIQTKALIQPTGTVPIKGYVEAQVKAYEQSTGKVPILGYSEAQVKSYQQPTGRVPILGYSEAQVRALLQPTGTVPIFGYSESQVKSREQPQGFVGLLARSESQVKSLSNIVFGAVTALTGYVSAMTKALLNTPNLPVSISGRSEGQVKAADQPQGSVGISARSEVMVKTLSSASLFSFLSAFAKAMAKSTIKPSGFTSLSARSESQVKDTAQPQGAVLLLATSTIQTKSYSPIVFGNFVNLIATAFTAVQSLALSTLSGTPLTSAGRTEWTKKLEQYRRVDNHISAHFTKLGQMSGAARRMLSRSK